MALINIANLTFGYDGSYDTIFEDVSFQIDTDWRLGFVGRNGRGKTTFLNLLMGKYEYSGTITKSVTVDYFPFDVTDQTRNTIDVIGAICPDTLLWEINRELNLLELKEEVLDRRYDTLSNGEQTKVLLAALFLKHGGFLLIDEPTNHLDAHARQLVSDYLKTKKGFILVSHDRQFLDRCIDHVLSINRGNIEVQRGNFSSWWRNKAQQDQYELAQNETLKKDIKKISAAAKRTANWSDQVEQTKIGTKSGGLKPDRGYVGHKAAKMMKRAKSLEARQQDAIDEKSKLLQNIETAESLRITPLRHHAERLVELRDVSISYGEQTICTKVSFTIEQGERVCITGHNGSGKSSILKLIRKEEMQYSGHLHIASGVIISYISQDTSFLTGDLKDFCAESKIDESLCKAILRKLDFARVQFEKDMTDFSEGQKKKVLLARSLCDRAHLYIWDEPLNFIDVYSRMQMEELILRYKPTMLFVEHDAAFCQAVATKVVTL